MSRRGWYEALMRKRMEGLARTHKIWGWWAAMADLFQVLGQFIRERDRWINE